MLKFLFTTRRVKLVINTLLLGQRKENLNFFSHLRPLLSTLYRCFFAPIVFSCLHFLHYHFSQWKLHALYWTISSRGVRAGFTQRLWKLQTMELTWDYRETETKVLVKIKREKNHCLNFKDLVKICRFAAKPLKQIWYELVSKES